VLAVKTIKIARFLGVIKKSDLKTCTACAKGNAGFEKGYIYVCLPTYKLGNVLIENAKTLTHPTIDQHFQPRL
jgi:hypothetical protein